MNPTITDPAWFYSSLAQASASVVGLIGAILITRLMDHIVSMRTARRGIDESVGRHFHRVKGYLAELSSFRGYLTNEIHEDDVALKGPGFREITSYRTFGGSGSGPPQRIADLQTHRADKAADLRAVDIMIPIYRSLQTEFQGLVKVDAQVAPVTQAIDDLAFHERARDILRGDAQSLETLLQSISAFRDKAIPYSFRVIVMLLAWLSAVGIVAPLSALPGLSGNPWYGQTVLLTGFALGVFGLLGYFLYLFVELWRLGRFHWPSIVSTHP